MPHLLPWKRLKALSYWAVMRPITRPVAAGEELLRLAVLEERVQAPVEEQPPLQTQRGHPDRRVSMQAVRQLDELLQIAPRRDGLHGHRAQPIAPYMPTAIDVFAKVRGHERAEQLQAARDADLLPYFRLVESPAAPVVEMEGAERVMLGSNNYLGLTGDERVLAGRARRARAVRHRADRLAPAQRHDAAAPRPRARAGGVDGHRGGDRLHHRPPGQRGHARDAAGARRHRDRRLRRPRLDPRRLPALAGQAAPVPPQPARQAREDARARGRRRRRRARGRRRRVLDGGRRRPAAGDRRRCARRTARG